MSVFLFPGQGAQQKGMGARLMKMYPDYLETAAEVLGYPLAEIITENPQNKLNNTLYTQPALFVINTLYYLYNYELKSAPSALAGHSLGELNALHAAGVFDFETGLRIVQKRAELMSQANNGGMAAVIGLDPDRIQQILDEQQIELDIANRNAPDQIVISGAKALIQSAKTVFENAGATYMPLNVSGAFHSRLMREAATEFSAFIEPLVFKKMTVPVIANFTARPYEAGREKQTLCAQINGQVKWMDTIHYLVSTGEYIFYEIGPGEILTRLNRKILNTTLSC